MEEDKGERDKMVLRFVGKGMHGRGPGGRNKLVPIMAEKGRHERGLRSYT